MGMKQFYVVFKKDSPKAFRYTVVEAELHSDAKIYADNFWGAEVHAVFSSTRGYELRKDPRYTELGKHRNKANV